MIIKIDDLTGSEIANLLQEHLEDMHSTSPPESVHALDLEKLRKPDITFWTVWIDDELAGCGALKELNPDHAEIKSMRTKSEFRRRGVATMLLRTLIEEASRRGYRRLSLETGSMSEFNAAHKLYEQFNFEKCGPFANYRDDPNSLFMTKEIVGVQK